MLIPNCTIMTKRGGTIINAALPARIQPPSQEQITATGGLVQYYVKVLPLPPTMLREQTDLVFVIDCPTNPQVVAASAAGWQVEDRRERAGFFPATIFAATRKVQP